MRSARTVGDHVMTGPKGLLAGVLLRALSDIREGNGFAPGALAWLNSDRADGPLTFRAICSALDLDPSAVRKAVPRRGDEMR